jgi:hypothetical protein
MVWSAEKIALPARPALFQRLVAIDLVFDEFSFKNPAKKIMAFLNAA